MNELFGPELTVKLEKTSHKKLCFLESRITMEKGKIVLEHYNKNIKKSRKLEKRIVRYPNAMTNHFPHIFSGIIIDALKKLGIVHQTQKNKLYQ